MTKDQTAADLRKVVESILHDTNEACRVLKDERKEFERVWTHSSYDVATGKIRAYSMVLDAFAEAGFRIGGRP
jgi:hypothetical protein